MWQSLADKHLFGKTYLQLNDCYNEISIIEVTIKMAVVLKYFCYVRLC